MVFENSGVGCSASGMKSSPSHGAPIHSACQEARSGTGWLVVVHAIIAVKRSVKIAAFLIMTVRFEILVKDTKNSGNRCCGSRKLLLTIGPDGRAMWDYFRVGRSAEKSQIELLQPRVPSARAESVPVQCLPW